MSGAIIGISGAKMRGKITVSQNFRGKNSRFQGQKWDSRILGILFGGKNSEFQGQFPANILIENSCILFNQKITKKWRKLMI
ncbi:hypothetical protein [Escherichia coli]|uniref:hypothetical protein n=1 Tax=Escherichia coli TaxID=562 RepID=UPI00141A3FEF|nr:hypothetical protein [Escherichia coli]